MDLPWLQIPLADYEAHMALPDIGQAQMLAAEFGRALALTRPSSVAVVGCAGGNGFERIDPRITRRIVAIDINPEFLRVLESRFAKELPGLQTHCMDIESLRSVAVPVDLVYAALIFEYVDIGASLRTLASLCRAGGTLVSVLQLPSGTVAPVSPSPYRSLQRLAPCMRLVEPAVLTALAQDAGFAQVEARSVKLDSGKSFAVQIFRRRS